MAIHPFQNEADSVTIDELNIENRLDRISVYGSIQISRDKIGLDFARELKATLEAIVHALEADKSLPERITVIAPDATDNPFQ